RRLEAATRRARGGGNLHLGGGSRGGGPAGEGAERFPRGREGARSLLGGAGVRLRRRRGDGVLAALPLRDSDRAGTLPRPSQASAPTGSARGATGHTSGRGAGGVGRARR